MKNKYINIGFSNYIPLGNIEIITDYYQLKSFKIKQKELSLRDKYINLSGKRKSQSCIVTSEPMMFRTFNKSKTLIKNNFEEYFLSINYYSSTFINLNKIEFIADYDLNKTTVKNLLEEKTYENNLYDLTKRKKSRSIILMKETNNVYISPINAQTLINRV